MYARPGGARYRAPVQIPQNYSGNAFAPHHEELPIPTDQPHEKASETDHTTKDTPISPPKSILPSLPFRFDLKHLFSGGIGTEELLILGLILLLMGGDGCDDIILLLILLFFIQ